MKIQEILNKDHLNIEDIKSLLTTSNRDEIDLIFEKSIAVKQLFMGSSKSKILSIQFSNYCENKCIYCELKEESNAVERFRLTPDEVLDKIRSIFSTGISNIILQSGKDSFYDTDMISYLIYKIKQEYDVEITLDLLQRDFNEYRAWKFSGADNYLLKFNTSNSHNFSLFTIDNKLEERLNHITYLRRIGYKICTGNIIGLPHQADEDLANDLLLLKNFKPEMILNTPFNPQNLKGYSGQPKDNFNKLLLATAITRILLKKSHIIIAASSNLYSVQEKKKLFKIGGDTLMLEALIQGKVRRVTI